ncbi:MAG TPA: DUF1844 domain-containing protein [Thermoanaerobaculia bacterium]|jgi:hypothetical protein|nr:DUF1844 domain-containing protein [Thermoanaerobaculia bacterium]
MKVTDKRMFTPEGELREEYRFLNEKSTATEPAPEASRPEVSRSEPLRPEPEPARPQASRSEPSRPQPSRHAAGYPEPAESSGLGLPGTPQGGPGFLDLAAMLAEPAAIYLGDAPLPDGQWAEDLEMARLHIDLLDVLRQKTDGNLTAQEAAILEDLIYRLRVRYVQKHG